MGGGSTGASLANLMRDYNVHEVFPGQIPSGCITTLLGCSDVVTDADDRIFEIREGKDYFVLGHGRIGVIEIRDDAASARRAVEQAMQYTKGIDLPIDYWMMYLEPNAASARHPHYDIELYN